MKFEPGQLFETLSELAKRFTCNPRTLKRERQRDASFPAPLRIGRQEKFDVALVIAFFQRKGRVS